ncbi:hypothetical protein E3U43_005305 [Larimichthys crocea]|uniref:Uncharacterized protein n=1 Tax=Larimichthys crocea TaxID=215358 RepID=A0ACD3QFT0_LARCR|nr:hypothetical protein E3U43_005305 [Larimichthys crocea]
METSNQPQSVAMFQNQSQAQLSQMQQQSTPMEQQQSPQQNQQQPPQLPMGPQSSLFQSISNHSQANSVPQSPAFPTPADRSAPLHHRSKSTGYSPNSSL